MISQYRTPNSLDSRHGQGYAINVAAKSATGFRSPN